MTKGDIDRLNADLSAAIWTAPTSLELYREVCRYRERIRRAREAVRAANETGLQALVAVEVAS